MSPDRSSARPGAPPAQHATQGPATEPDIGGQCRIKLIEPVVEVVVIHVRQRLNLDAQVFVQPPQGCR
jgi:hypothetical protein